MAQTTGRMRFLANGELWELLSDNRWHMRKDEREIGDWDYSPVSAENFDSYERCIAAGAALRARRLA